MIYILETIYVIKFMCDCISVEQCLNVWNEDNIIIVDVFAMTLISVFIYVLEMVFIFAHQGDRLVFNAFFFFTFVVEVLCSVFESDFAKSQSVGRILSFSIL